MNWEELKVEIKRRWNEKKKDGFLNEVDSVYEKYRCDLRRCKDLDELLEDYFEWIDRLMKDVSKDEEMFVCEVLDLLFEANEDYMCYMLFRCELIGILEMFGMLVRCLNNDKYSLREGYEIKIRRLKDKLKEIVSLM